LLVSPLFSHHQGGDRRKKSDEAYFKRRRIKRQLKYAANIPENKNE